jgi:hypothetical protein
MVDELHVTFMQNKLSMSIRWGLTFLIVIVTLPVPVLCLWEESHISPACPWNASAVWRVVPDVLVLPRSGPGAPARWQAAGDVSWSRLLPCRCIGQSRVAIFSLRPRLPPQIWKLAPSRFGTVRLHSERHTPLCEYAAVLPSPCGVALPAAQSGALCHAIWRCRKEAISMPK